MADQDQAAALKFPVRGIDTSMGYNQQPPGTCPSAANVRAFDAGTLRMRGGSRPGLTPFLGAGSTAQVSGFNLVQHVQVVVWVSSSAVG